MKYFVTTLPSDPAQRAARVTFERSQGGTLYRRADGTHVIVRTAAAWPFPSPALVSIDAIPGDWTEIIA